MTEYLTIDNDYYQVKMIADSLAPCGKRLTTITARYPRIVHAEIMTHRDRERNAASSRAIPSHVMSEAIKNHPFVPLMWGLEKSGMQMGEQVPPELTALANELWLEARDKMVEYAKAIANIGETFNDTYPGEAKAEWQDIRIHKSLPNRLTEPWMWITVVMSATEWKNFYRLRCHPDAEIHFQKIAGMMRDLHEQSKPTPLDAGNWHLPFIWPSDWIDAAELVDTREQQVTLIKNISVARCARVSYLTHEGKRSLDKDIELFDRLIGGSGFGHYSPHGHVACACKDLIRSGPFIGYSQYRKEFPLENVEG